MNSTNSVQFTPDPYAGVPAWVMRKIERAAWAESLTVEEYIKKYNPQLDPAEWDNDPGSPEQAWA